MLATLNLHNVIYQLYFNKREAHYEIANSKKILLMASILQLNPIN